MTAWAARAVGHTGALWALGVYGVAWIACDGAKFGFEDVLALLGIGMVIVIQRSQNQDTAAIKKAIAELVHVTAEARDEIAEDLADN